MLISALMLAEGLKSCCCAIVDDGPADPGSCCCPCWEAVLCLWQCKLWCVDPRRRLLRFRTIIDQLYVHMHNVS